MVPFRRTMTVTKYSAKGLQSVDMKTPPSQSPIHHIWFDLEGTLTIPSPEREADHRMLLVASYAEVVHKIPSEALWHEYCDLYAANGSNSAVFRSLGLPSDYWQTKLMSMDEAKYYQPDERVYETLQQLKLHCPISLFSNVKTAKIRYVLDIIGVQIDWFTYVLAGDDVAERKPALDGFYKIIELTHLFPNQILYVGDRVKADILPAHAVGMQAALVWSTNPEADYSFTDFKELRSLF
jgi:HAD superfamily hydrolase (TIGR01549 family)